VMTDQITSNRRRLAFGSAPALLATVALAACAGGGSTGGSVHAASKNVTVQFKFAGNGAQSKLHRLQVARRTKERLSPKYVSLATEGIAIYVYPASQSPGSTPTAVADVSSTSPYCSTDTDGSGDRFCAVPVTAPPGTDDFLVDGYDQPPSGGKVAGNLLETGTDTGVSISASGANQVNLTFDGVVASVQMQPNWVTAPANGTTSTIPFALNAFDADNYTIVDTTPFENSLKISIANDPNGTMKIIKPGSGTNPSLYNLEYNGGALTDGQLVGTADGISSTSTLDLTPLVNSPNSLTVKAGQTGTFTSQMAPPAGVTPSGYFGDYIAQNTSGTYNCTVSPGGSSNVGTDQAYPWTDGNPVTFTVTGVLAGSCQVYVFGPITNDGLATSIVNVTVTN
jgi:hypothetical protein